MGRFINADALISSGQVILGNNMFAYCQNNPVNKVDPNGEAPILLALLVIATTFVAISTGVNFMVNVVNKDKIDKEIEDTYTQDKAKQEIDQILSKYGTDSHSYVTFKDDNAEITGSSNVTSRYDRQKISMIITRTDGLTERSTGNLSAEWAGHNAAVIIPRYREQALNVNLDYTRDSRPWIRYATKALEIMGWE